MTSTLHHWIEGKPYDGTSPRYGDIFDPAHGRVTARAPLASADDASAAVKAARQALDVWSDTPLAKRTKKSSLFGTAHVHGEHGVHFNTRTKTVASRWPSLERPLAMDLGFPQQR